MPTQITSLGVRLDYLTARKYVKEHGMKLVPHPLLDGVLASRSEIAAIKDIDNTQPQQWWTEGILVCLPPGQRFQTRVDVVDDYVDRTGRSFVFLGSDVPREVIDYQIVDQKARVGLLVTPQDFELDRKRVVAHPETN